MILVICKMCGADFKTRRSHAKTCSNKCRSRLHSLRHRNKTRHKVCTYCGKTFICNGGLASSRLYCNKDCRNSSRYIRDFNSDERVKKNLRSRLRDALRGRVRSGSAVRDLGCSISDLRKHLEYQFKPGMSWDNYGQWHIDHIVPLSNFDLSKENELKQACHYSNLQPLWAKENLVKGSKK